MQHKTKSVRLGMLLVLCALALFSVTPALADQRAEAEKTFTMGEAVQRGLQANPQMAGIRAALRGAEFGERAAQAAFYPALTTNFGYSYVDEAVAQGDRGSWTANLNLSQPLFTGWRLLNTRQRAELAREQVQLELINRELALTLTIQEQFLELLRARENVRSARDSFIRLESQLRNAQAFFDVGLRPKFDVLQAEVDLAQAEQLLLISENAVATQNARLNTLLNLDLETPVTYVGELTYSPFAPRLQDSLDMAFSQRPDIAMALKAEEIADRDVDITASDLYPQVSADLDYYRRSTEEEIRGITTRPDSWWTTGVNVRWRAFDFNRTRHATDQARQNVLRLREETANLRLEVSFAVQSLHLNLNEAAARISVANKALEEAREGFRIAQARFQAQVGTNTEVLDAQARLTRSEADLTDAMADHQLAIARLFAATGEMNPGLEF
ncbi:Outer membrane efflux protein [Desulfonatronum thiosulfatophilum]|uniref:Outer membrane efflux protein n=1 Tax=Desulfonatronum thiosulfatophilum TaxID=617002 RepID=A0A1G6EAB2_9BACT|nr:TolC family protein [Desulfonatronum thiosulfatophilum]SDB54282.1 Outer membrane efflux protein [Desulfonatronum thiosulfatophilum]